MKKKNKLVEGIVVRNPRGFGWLVVEDGPKDLFIPPRDLLNLLDGDRVRCSVLASPKGPVARLEGIVERSSKTLVGVLEKKGKTFRVTLPEGVLGGVAKLDKAFSDEFELLDNSAVEIRVTKFPNKNRSAEVKIEKVLGQAGSFATEIQKLITDSGVLQEFPSEVIKEAAKFGSVPSAKDQKGRLNLKDVPLCTIDGKTAKDFDDAVFAKKVGEDYVVYVAIADVSHYVVEDSHLDIQAFTRATSIYYPGKCIPMLPENISNGLCSLMPTVDRLCMAVEMVITKKGSIKKVDVHNAVMNSHARLTYEDVQEFLDDNSVGESISEGVKESLLVLREAALALRMARQKRGAIDFDITESLIALGENGEPINIHPDQRLESHRLIEDLMVATNESMAAFSQSKSWPNIYRIHDEPSEEKLATFFEFGEAIGLITAKQLVAWKKKTKAQVLSIIADMAIGHSAQVAISTMLLRTMMQAQYSANNIGHFGLASKGYLHFTSPIRRYPDLISHRIIKEIIRRKKKYKLTPAEQEAVTERLNEIAEHCSQQERKAVELERDISAFHATWFMRNRIGVTDEAVVTGVTEFGVFVKLLRYHVEGLVHVSNMKKTDFLEFDSKRLRLTGKKSGFSIGLGEKLTVRLIGADLIKRRLDLEIA